MIISSVALDFGILSGYFALLSGDGQARERHSKRGGCA